MLSNPLHRTFLLTLLGVVPQVWCAQPTRSPEYELKAKVLLSLGGHVNWPGSARREGQPFVIGVLGDSPFERFLDDLGRSRVVHNRKVSITYLRTLNPAAILGCDILFICDSEYDRVMDILRICKGKPTLTVSDTVGFGSRGVILNLLVSDTIGFEVNTRVARESGLEIGSSLLASPRTRILQEP